MPAQCALEFRESVIVVIVHLSHVLDELGLRLAVPPEPVLIDESVGIVVLAIHVILIQSEVTVLVYGIHWTVVNVIIGT